jgi:ketosteroid isomerase-like protein
VNPTGQGPAAVVERLLEAVNAHDLEAMVALFADDYRNETPAHPQRGFRGSGQVRRNWTQLFAGVPDLGARLPRMTVEGDTVWTEWDLSGTRGDGAAFLMRGGGHLRRRRRRHRLGAVLPGAGRGNQRRRRRPHPPGGGHVEHRRGHGGGAVMILVAGGTGTLGTQVVRRLSDRGLRVRVLTRDPTRAAHLPATVQTLTGDLRDPAAVAAAVRGLRDGDLGGARVGGSRQAQPGGDRP